jgi:hypothetical protein
MISVSRWQSVRTKDRALWPGKYWPYTSSKDLEVIVRQCPIKSHPIALFRNRSCDILLSIYRMRFCRAQVKFRFRKYNI